MTLEDLFPDLPTVGYRITSPSTPDYNCIAWAVGDNRLRWDFAPGYYWPRRVPRNGLVETVVQLFKTLKFMTCETGDSEPEFEKVALYAVENAFTHVARQTPDGKWTSKLGTLEDISHDSPEGLEGDEYGQVVRYMKRRLESPTQTL